MRPETDNPLGRVLVTFKDEAQRLEEEQDAEVVELRISEAVLKEVPKLERFQSASDSRWPQARLLQD